MLTVVLWKWGTRYGRDHLVKMQAMLARCLSMPYRIICITDDPKGVPTGMGYFPVRGTIPYPDHKCIRRMWLYGGKPNTKGKWWPGDLGDRLLQLDLDVVLTAPLDPLVDRPDPLVIWKSESTVRPVTRPHGWAYNATILLLTPGARRDVWDRYQQDRRGVEKAANKDGWDVPTCSDQAVATFLLKDGPVSYWTNDDGIYAYRAIAGPNGEKDKGLPANCRLVSFHGRSGARHPGVPELQAKSPWIQEHWR